MPPSLRHQIYYPPIPLYSTIFVKCKTVSRADLAERIGVNQSVLTHWGKGESNPSIEKIPEIARILGVTIGHLFGEDGEGRSLDLEPVCATNAVSDEPSAGGLDYAERSDYREIIKTNTTTIATIANTNATQSGTIDKQTDILASQHRLIEAMVVDNKATKK
jgi:transcriptional regulator with XRE-family HTH domain